jgi:hypothetical protein
LVRIDLAAEHLGRPGPGELSASLETPSVVAATISHAIERHARVDLELVTAEPRGFSDDGIPVEVRARSAGGPVNAGSIEATVDDHSVGAAPVRAGRATVVPAFASPREGLVAASIRYLPDAPWWEPGRNLEVRLRLNAPSAWSRAGPIALALVVAAWMLRGSWLPGLLQRAPSRRRRPPEAGQSALRIVGAEPASGGWLGTVIDAHDGAPLAGAHVSIEVPSFPGAEDGTPANWDTTTDLGGSFRLPSVKSASRPVLRVHARWHTPFEQPLPPPCELSVRMVSRRRHLLDRLVSFAAREWGPWHGVHEPTPADIASRARRAAREKPAPEGAREVEQWARAVEGTVFGAADVDEVTESAVAALEPTAHAASRGPAS